MLEIWSTEEGSQYFHSTFHNPDTLHCFSHLVKLHYFIRKATYSSILWLPGKESACNAGDLGSIFGLGRSPGEGNGYPLKYSGLKNSMDRGAWQAIVHGVTKSRIWPSNFHFHPTRKDYYYSNPLMNDMLQLLGQELYRQETCCLMVTLEDCAE